MNPDVYKHPKQTALIPTNDDLESDLHDMIISWCRRQDPQVPFGHGRMDKRTGRTPGEPDFYLMLPNEKLLLVECKTEKNDFSEDQQKFTDACHAVGHTVHLVRSYNEFLSVIRALEQQPKTQNQKEEVLL